MKQKFRLKNAKAETNYIIAPYRGKPTYESVLTGYGGSKYRCYPPGVRLLFAISDR